MTGAWGRAISWRLYCLGSAEYSVQIRVLPLAGPESLFYQYALVHSPSSPTARESKHVARSRSVVNTVHPNQTCLDIYMVPHEGNPMTVRYCSSPTAPPKVYLGRPTNSWPSTSGLTKLALRWSRPCMEQYLPYQTRRNLDGHKNQNELQIRFPHDGAEYSPPKTVPLGQTRTSSAHILSFVSSFRSSSSIRRLLSANKVTLSASNASSGIGCQYRTMDHT